MLDLITTTEELQYETYRQQQMETRKHGEPKVKKMDNPKFKEEEEMLRKRFTEQVKAEEARFRQWEQHLIAERDRLNRDLGAFGLLQRSITAEEDYVSTEVAHSSIKSLESELDQLQGGAYGGR